MNWLVLVLLAVVARAFYSISSKLVTDKIKLKSSTLAVLLAGFAALMSLAISPFIGGLDFSGAKDLWWVAVFLAASQGIGNVIYYKGQKHLDSGTTQVVLSSKLAITALLAFLFLGSTFSYVQVVGMTILTISLLLVQKDIKFGKLLDRGSLFILASSFLFSIFAITGAKLSDTLSPAGYLVIVYAGAMVASFLVAPKQVATDLRHIGLEGVSVLRYMGLSALMSTIYFSLVYFAYIEAEDAGLVAILINAQVVTTVLVAAVLLKERQVLARKFVAGALVLLAAYLISGV